MPLPGKNELQDFVDSPNETLGCEYKSWIDLGDNGARASLARHIAALSNHGGGAIVAGFTDETPPRFAGANPHQIAPWNKDTIAGIVRKYLEPTFQCDVYVIKSATGNDHPVIVVPPHGAVPICAKANGPLDASGKPAGITQGTHYTRKPGPESAPVINAAEWAPIIRRCAMHDRASVLSMIDAAIRGRGPTRASIDDALKQFHEATHSVFLADATAHGRAAVAKWHFQFSYAVERENGQEVDPNQLRETLRQVNLEVQDLVRTGWSMIRVFERPGMAPFFTSDAGTGQEDMQFLECALIRDPAPRGAAEPDMWRVTPGGIVTLIRAYAEDHVDLNRTPGFTPGTWLSPNLLAPALAEFVRHARAFAERFETPTTVSFRCEWHGLDGRRANDPHSLWSPHPPAGTGHCVATGSWAVAALASDWPRIVAHLAGPLARILDISDVFTPEWILGQAPKWLRW